MLCLLLTGCGSCTGSSPTDGPAQSDAAALPAGWWVTGSPATRDAQLAEHEGTAWLFGEDVTATVRADGTVDRQHTTVETWRAGVWKLTLGPLPPLLLVQADASVSLHSTDLHGAPLHPASEALVHRLNTHLQATATIEEACRREQACCAAAMPDMGGGCDHDPRDLGRWSVRTCAEGIRNLATLRQLAELPVPSACATEGLPDSDASYAPPSAPEATWSGLSPHLEADEAVRYAWAADDVDAAVLAEIPDKAGSWVLTWPALKEGLLFSDSLVVERLEQPQGGWQLMRRVPVDGEVTDTLGNDWPLRAQRPCGIAQEQIVDYLSTTNQRFREILAAGDESGAIAELERWSQGWSLDALARDSQARHLFLRSGFERWTGGVHEDAIQATLDGTALTFMLKPCGDGVVVESVRTQ